jgi:hypothetical protein
MTKVSEPRQLIEHPWGVGYKKIYNPSGSITLTPDINIIPDRLLMPEVIELALAFMTGLMLGIRCWT